jgi:cysteine desulfurase
VIYFDFNATTPVDPRVVADMLPFFTETFGNAASIDHSAGNSARQAVEDARSQVARLIGGEAKEIVFTSGATEANNIALLGIVERAGADATVVIGSVEHPSVRDPARTLGDRCHFVPVNADGIVDVDALEARLSPATALVSVMAANNETGAIQPIEEIAAICWRSGIPFHVDATQAVGRMPFSVATEGISLVSFSAHKIYGPKGVGALWVRSRPRMKVAPILFGGGQERQLRPGTLNVPGIVGFGRAAELARLERKADVERMKAFRERLVERLCAECPAGIVETVPARFALPQTLHLRFPAIGAHAVMRELALTIALAAGSACSTASVEPSHVLLAQGLNEDEISEALRISFGRSTTAADIDEGATLLAAATNRLARLDRAA